jgi:hypothetical protein
MKIVAISLLAAVLGGCAVVPVGYGRHGHGDYRGHGYYRGDGYRDADRYYRGDGHYRGDGYRGYRDRDRGG